MTNNKKNQIDCDQHEFIAKTNVWWMVRRSRIIHIEHLKLNFRLEQCVIDPKFEFEKDWCNVMKGWNLWQDHLECLPRVIFYCVVHASCTFRNSVETQDHRVIWMPTDQFNPRLQCFAFFSRSPVCLLHRSFIMQTKVWPIQFIMYRCVCDRR